MISQIIHKFFTNHIFKCTKFQSITLIQLLAACFSLAFVAMSRMNNEIVNTNNALSNMFIASSAASSSTTTVVTSIKSMTNNLSCFVCTTIDDLNCKFINETLNRYQQQQQQQHNSMMIDDFDGIDSNDVYMNNNHNQNNHINDNHHQQHDHNHHYTIDSIISSSTVDNGNSNSYDLLLSNEDQSSSSLSTSAAASDQGHNYFDNNLLNKFRTDCTPNEQYCVVLRLGVSAPDNVQEFNFFALKRSCAEQCQDGCFIIGNGEKTKLSICSSCCQHNYCNVGNSAQSSLLRFRNQWMAATITMTTTTFMIVLISLFH